MRLKNKIKYWYRGLIGKTWIKNKRRSVRINIDYDNYAWLKADLRELKIKKGWLRCKRLYEALK